MSKQVSPATLAAALQQARGEHLDTGLERLATSAAAGEGGLVEYGQCGSLAWTVEEWGRVTHKHACPNRTDPWCQTHPQGEPQP